VGRTTVRQCDIIPDGSHYRIRSLGQSAGWRHPVGWLLHPKCLTFRFPPFLCLDFISLAFLPFDIYSSRGLCTAIKLYVYTSNILSHPVQGATTLCGWSTGKSRLFRTEGRTRRRGASSSLRLGTAVATEKP
jgi:hypothetical protein